MARLFDADRSDKEFELSSNSVGSVGKRQLLWVDTTLDDDSTDGDDFLDSLPFGTDEVRRLWASTSGPRLTVHGDYFLARVVAMRQSPQGDKPVVLDLAVGKNVVLTAHRQPVEFLADLSRRITGDTTLGEIDSADFASVLLDGLVINYLELTDAILAEVDTLDGEALKPAGRPDLLSDLVALRHRIAAARRVLVAHRAVIAAMAGADFHRAIRCGDQRDGYGPGSPDRNVRHPHVEDRPANQRGDEGPDDRLRPVAADRRDRRIHGDEHQGALRQ